MSEQQQEQLYFEMKKSSGSSMGPDSAMDLEDRDPNNLNEHLQVNLSN